MYDTKGIGSYVKSCKVVNQGVNTVLWQLASWLTD